jgi:methylmalonyl-CoA/ethylmalonyl-CoA epimerase
MHAKLDHVGIAVRNLEDAIRGYARFGLRPSRDASAEGLRIAFLPVGDSQLELLEPTGPDTVVGKFIERRGEGLHHLCFEVNDLQAALTELTRQGVELIDRSPRPGIDGKVAFIHPRSCGGVLIELVEKPSDVAS